MTSSELAKKTTTIYFSKDRPMQLELTLRTNKEHSTNWHYQYEIVLYKASNDRFEKCYQVLNEEYNVTFIKENNFKEDLLDIVKDLNYVLFVVDDTIFTEKYSLDLMIRELQNFPTALGFSLRLGRNTQYCYPLYVKNEIPYFEDASNYRFSRFNWQKVKIGDFSYPLELSSSIYRMSDIGSLLSLCDYNTPNSLEWAMSQNLSVFNDKPDLLCPKESVAFSNPINRVQTENTNRVGSKPEYTIDALLEKFEQGYRIKNTFDGFVSNGCHQEVNIEFI